MSDFKDIRDELEETYSRLISKEAEEKRKLEIVKKMYGYDKPTAEELAETNGVRKSLYQAKREAEAKEKLKELETSGDETIQALFNEETQTPSSYETSLSGLGLAEDFFAEAVQNLSNLGKAETEMPVADVSSLLKDNPLLRPRTLKNAITMCYSKEKNEYPCSANSMDEFAKEIETCGQDILVNVKYPKECW